VEMLRDDLATFGKQDSDDADGGKRPGPDQMRLAEEAIVRELQKLYNAVAPIVMSQKKAG
jgi:hypothetical protein